MNKLIIKLALIITLLILNTNANAIAPLLLGLFGAGEIAADGALVAGAGESATLWLESNAVSTTVSLSQALKNSALLHGALAAITLTGDTSRTSHQTAPISIILDPNTPLITPPNWSQAIAASQQPTPPQTATPIITYSNGTTAGFTTRQAACEAYKSIFQTNYPTYTTTITSNNPICNLHVVTPNNEQFDSQQNIPASTSCPIGYSDSSGTCTLINATVVQKPSDKICQLIATPTQIIPDPSDPDCSNAQLLADGIDTTDPSKITITNPTKTDQKIIKPIDTHRVEIEHIYSDSSGNTVHDKVAIDPSPPNDNTPITGLIHSVNQGTGSLETPTNTAAVFDKSGLATTTGQSQQLNATNTTNQKLDELKTQQCGTTGKPSCNTKIDETGIQDITIQANTTQSTNLNKIDSWFDQLTGLANNTKDGVGQGYTTPITALIPTGGTCVNPVLDATNVNPNAFMELKICEHSNDVQPILKWCCYAFTLFACWGVIFTKVGGT